MSASLGDIIRDRRTARGWDQPELANRLEVSQQTLSRWENNGATPRRAKLAMLSAILEIELVELQSASARSPQSMPRADAVLAHVPPPLPNLPLDLLNEEQFEEFAVALAQELNPGANVYRNGGRGHKQYGIDVFIDRPDGQPRGGIQCKKVAQFGEAKVRKAVEEFDESTNVRSPAIYLSRPVSPKARKVIEDYPGWTIHGSDDLSRQVRRLTMDAQLCLIRRFFPGLRQAFLGSVAPTPWLSSEDYRRPLDSADGLFSQGWELVGRATELQSLVEFAESESNFVYVLEAPAGSGKTRLLLGFADLKADDPTTSVRFLDPGSDVSATDFESLPETDRLIVLVEDAHRRTDLSSIIRGIRAKHSRARIVLAARSHSRTELQEQLRSVGLSLREGENLFRLSSFTFMQARELAAQVVEPPFRHSRVLDALAQLGIDSPFFAVVGGQLLNQGRISTTTLESSPELRTEVLSAFRTAMVGAGGDADAQVRIEILTAVAAMQPFRSDDENFQGSMERLIGKKYRHVAVALSQLEDAGLLIRKGASYRVSPDLLGDIILSQALVNAVTGVVTSYAKELVVSLDDNVMEHALVNVSRAAAHIQAAGSASPTTIEAIWEPLMTSVRMADSTRRVTLAGLLKKVAYYQPQRSREASEWMLANPFTGPESQSVFERFFDSVPPDTDAVRRALIPVLQRVALHMDELPAAMSDLRDLIGKPERRFGKDEDPASIALRELVDLSAPLSYIELALDTALGWLDEQGVSDELRVAVMDIVAPVLAAEFTTNRSEGVTVYLGSRLVEPSAVRSLRRKVIKLVVFELQSGVPARSGKASELLEAAFRYPVGFYGEKIAEVQQQAWVPDFKETLDLLREVLRRSPTLPVVEAIRRSLSWHATYGTDAFALTAKALWAQLPSDLESRVSLALRDSSPMVESTDYEIMYRLRQEWQAKVADEVVADSEPAETLDLVEVILQRHRELGLVSEPNNFMSALFARESRLSGMLIDRVVVQSESSLIEVLSLALQIEFLLDPEKIPALVGRVVSMNSTSVRRVAAQALGWSVRTPGVATAGVVNCLATFMQDADEGVVRSALLGARLLSEIEPATVLDILHRADITGSVSVASDVAALFGPHGHLSWADVAQDDRAKILKGLELVRDIEDYDVGLLITAVSRDDHASALNLMLRRIEIEEESAREEKYRAIPFHAYADLTTQTKSIRALALARIWKWMLTDLTSWHRQHGGATLFWLVASPNDSDALAFLEAKSGGSITDFQLLATILHELPNSFVLNNYEFVSRLLLAAASAGDDAVKKIGSAFFASTVSGGRSRSIGVADPEDVQARDHFGRLSELATGIASSFFAELSAYFEREIQRNADEDADLLDRHDW